ncbi:MAG: potassium transporter TrkA [Nitrospinota bacterium]|nr:MAG: potassium transporter TrkA [Nitrospinota bacterium]
MLIPTPHKAEDHGSLSTYTRFPGHLYNHCLASQQIGQYFARIKLPLISGFLFTGIVAGPYILGLIPAEAIHRLRFIDELSLAFIAFAAGSELYLQELRSRFRSIRWVTATQLVFTFSLGSVAMFLLADWIPFMRGMSTTGRLAIALLAGAILVARSPSSAIAVINELRAKGPFTQTALGVTVIMDVIVIILFALNSSIADALFAHLPFDLRFLLLVLAELLISIAIGYGVGTLLRHIVALRTGGFVKAALILLAGYGVFLLSLTIRELSHVYLPFEILLEPLLICMIGSFVVTNYSDYRTEFLQLLHDIGPPVYIAFFTLTGASLALDILLKVWPIALVLFLARLGGIFIGSLSGGILAGDPMRYNWAGGMAYVTQAGVGLGLAKEVAVEFPEWGTAFATVIIAVIVLNQIVGPPCFKWALHLAGEAHPRADTPEFDGTRDVIIFGLESQSLALARQLRAHGWQVKIASRKAQYREDVDKADVPIQPIVDLTAKTLHELGVERAEAIVTLLSDEESYQVCELAYEHFGIRTLVVRLHNRENFERFHRLGALIVDPSTAIVSLLDHFVRSPSAASLFLGTEEDQDIVDIEVRNPALHGVALRDLRLPLDTLVLSIHRNGRMLISHGYTRLEVGDMVTIVGSVKSLDEVARRFET